MRIARLSKTPSVQMPRSHVHLAPDPYTARSRCFQLPAEGISVYAAYAAVLGPGFLPVALLLGRHDLGIPITFALPTMVFFTN